MAEDFPYRVEITARAGELQRRFAALAPDQNSGEIVTVGGRIMLRREMGKLTFMTLTDWTGSVQLFAGAQWTDRFTELNKLSLGDWVSATGEVVRTRTGELSVRVAGWACWPKPAALSPTSGAALPTSTPGTASVTRTCGPTTIAGKCCWPAAARFRLCAVSWRTEASSRSRRLFSTLSPAGRPPNPSSPITTPSIWICTCASRWSCT